MWPCAVDGTLNPVTYQPLRQLHSDLGDLNYGVCSVMKITRAEHNPDMEHLTQQTCFSPNVLTRDSKMPIMVIPATSDRSHI